MNELGYAFSLTQLWQVAGGQMILLFVGAILIFADLYLADGDGGKRISWLGSLTAIGILAALCHVIYREWSLSNIILMGVFSIEKFSAFVTIIILVAGLLSTLISIGYLRNNNLPRGEYFILLIFALYGAMAMIQSIDLLMMFIALEIMSIAIYVLAAFLKDDPFSQEGALKYFLLGSFGSAFFLFGVVLLYGITGFINLTHIAVILSSGLFGKPEVLIALAMIMVGLFFKMAMVPFHMWTPDVYEGSPSSVTGFMATMVKAVAFGAFIKVLFVGFTPILSESGNSAFCPTINLAVLGLYWKPVLWWLSLLTMFFGNFLAVSQQNVKRMLAYSSIAHAGYMALGILAGNDEGRMGVLFYLFSYTLMNIGAFGVLYIIDGNERKAQTLEDYRGLGYKYPGLSFLMSLFMVSMAGLPPTAGFIAKFYVFAAVIKEGYFLLAALGILTSVIGAYYYLRVLYMLYMKESSREIVAGPIAIPAMLALVVAAIGVLYLGVQPEGLASVTNLAQRSLSMIF
ncbi:MAG: NADH-quinone oxidoreductase subunit N [Dissulfurimicrobium sp.]|uniref:NADH-quinone oxidoreductase subunit N n=1 Tax=Dissulfurimicrobium sp. TaxID=2022436 RepID=UPI00404AE401